jgi:orotidine-5'-phosphate decarboxylase
VKNSRESRLPPHPRDRLIVALDLPSVRAAGTMVETLGDAVTFYKVGYQLAFAGGLAFVESLIGAGKRVFLDMKLHDIENTVSKGVESAAQLGVTFLTVHAYPQTMTAAVAARKGSDLKVLAVTVLTSYDDIDLAQAGYSTSVEALVALRAQQAHDLGMDGLVCSPEEASPLRLAVGNQMLFVTPGVRPAARAWRPEARRDARAGDQRGRGLSGGGPADHGRGRSEGGRAKRSSPRSPRQSSRGSEKVGSGLRIIRRRDREADMPKGTGSRTSMSAIPRATRPTWRRTRVPLRNTARKFLVRGGKFENPEGQAARATSCSSSRTTRPRSPATTRPNIRPRSSCAHSTPPAM